MLRRALPVALVAPALTLAAAGCGGGGGGDSSGSADAAPASGSPATGAASARGVKLAKVGTFSEPVYAIGAPGDRSRLFVVEQAGRIRVRRKGRTLGRPFLDIRSRVLAGGERGLLSMAFAPDYQRSGLFYVYFTGRNGDVRIQQFRRSSGNPSVADAASGRDVLRVAHSRYPNHNGGQLQFGPDGYLYAGLGDGGGGGDQDRRGQDLGTLLAKLVRIDPRPGGGYDVPAGNPFAGRSGARDEIWAYGLRNPYRFSFDRRTGDLTIGDVGQDRFEEVDFVRGAGRGANYGWSVFEGFSRFRSGRAPGHVKPVLAPSQDDGFCALIGGYVVRDAKLKALYGRYVYGDNCNPRIYSVRLRAGAAKGNRATGLRIGGLSSFGEDAAGHVYATSLGGAVYRLARK
ncbi:MAG TPA: PQQ-dependent sugar dehydrogenase [Thermoleophilaceae bacterium]